MNIEITLKKITDLIKEHYKTENKELRIEINEIPNHDVGVFEKVLETWESEYLITGYTIEFDTIYCISLTDKFANFIENNPNN